MLNLQMATNDELMRLIWQAEEEHDGNLYKRVKEEIKRRIKYDY